MKSINEFPYMEDYKAYLRIYFSGLAMQGLIISQGEKNVVNDWGVHGERISENAVHIADELIKQLNLKFNDSNS